mmetsp:Transcript_11869/g.17696  ORF Transcript_11869/g.17696 Transcript_11869/m.17696 type:complete len:308 (-) Transcript_11869:17-940(-)
MSRNRNQADTHETSLRLKEEIEKGNYYEALQLYKTSFARLRIQGKKIDAYKLLTEGTISLATKSEKNAATELALLLIESLEEDFQKKDDAKIFVYDLNEVKQYEKISLEESCNMLLEIANSYQTSINQIIFLKRAVKFLGNNTNPKANGLRLKLAQSYETMGEYGLAARFYSTTGKVEDYASLLERWAVKGYKNEQELFFCRAILHLLSIKREEDAAKIWDLIARNFSNTSKLGQFTLLLITMVRNRPIPPTQESSQSFTMFKDTFNFYIQRDSEIVEIISKIGENYFGMSPSSSGGLIGSLMQMLA